MTGFLRPRRLLTVASLTLVWCGLWTRVSVANVATGLAVSLAVIALGVGTANRGGIRPRPLARLMWLVAVDLVKSTISVAIEIATPRDRTNESIIAVDIPSDGRDHLLLLAIAVTLTPGTAVVDADPDSARLYLHLLHDDRRDATIHHVEELSRLACAALPTNHRKAAS